LKRSLIRLLQLCLLLAIVGSGVGWWYWQARGGAEDNPGPATGKVVRRSFNSTVLATGAVKPQVGAEVRVGARISGKVERLYANIGDAVKKGQLIAELEKRDLEATVAQREAELAMARAELDSVESLQPGKLEQCKADVSKWRATVSLMEKELARQETLTKSDVAAKQDRDRAQERLSVAQASLASATEEFKLQNLSFEPERQKCLAGMERAKAALENVQAQLSYATITAPISGAIASVSTQEGETVSAGLNAPTFVTIIDLERLQVDAYVDEVDIGRVAIDQRVLFSVDTFSAREFEGRVATIYPKAVIQENVVNYDVVVEIKTPYRDLLRPEMTASVTILLEERADVPAVPAKAVQREQGKNIVYILNHGIAEPVEVKVGWKDGQWIEIAAGLQEGQTVLLSAPASKPSNEDRWRND
jgi:HlyD family secretion protein